MKLAATRIITDDVDALVTFYEKVTSLTATRLHPLFAEFATPTGTLAIASSQTIGLLGEKRSAGMAYRVGDRGAVGCVTYPSMSVVSTRSLGETCLRVVRRRTEQIDEVSVGIAEQQ